MFTALFFAHYSFVGYKTHTKGDERDRHAFYLLLIYAVASFALWAVYDDPRWYFAALHLTGATTFLIYSTKLLGQLVGLIFCAMVLIDAGSIVGWIPFDRPQGALFAFAYPDLKGLMSHAILYSIGRGAGDPRLYRPLAANPFSRRDSDRGGLLNTQNAKSSSTGRTKQARKST